MALLKAFRAGMRALLRKRAAELELDEEIRGYLEQAVADKIASGMARDEALRQARIEMGHMEAAREQIHNLGWESKLESVAQDITYGLRTLRKNPGFTLVAALTLALGIAANAVIFSFTSAVMLHPPPVPDPDRLVVIFGTDPMRGDPNLNEISVPDFYAWKAASRSFSEIAAFERFGSGTAITSADAEPERVGSMRVAANYFSVLGVQPLLGRTFVQGEDRAGHDHVVVLSHDLWVQRFGSDRSIVGKSIGLDGEQYTVIGVMPSSFAWPLYHIQLWKPLTLNSAQTNAAARLNRFLCAVARLKPAVSVEQANAEIAGLARQAERDFPDTNKGWGAGVLTQQRFSIEEFQAGNAILLLSCAVAFVLMIACANIAGLLLARATARRREIAVRMALGASRWRVLRQLMTESLLIALIGGVLGILISVWGARLLRSELTFNALIATLDIGIDRNVLALTAAVSILTAFLFGFAPALQATRSDVQSALKDEGAAVSPGKKRNRSRSLLVTGEFALAVLLLSGSGILIQAMIAQFHQYLGFDSGHVLTGEIPLPAKRYPDPTSQSAFFTDLLQRTRALPGVRSAALAVNLPGTGAEKASCLIKGKEDLGPAKNPRARYYLVSPGYLATFEIPLLRGRDFSENDTATSRKVALINEEFARRFLPNVDPLGHFVRIESPDPGKSDWREIVGVVGDVKNWPGQITDDPQIYESYLQRPTSWMAVALRADGDPDLLAQALRRAVFQIDKQLPVHDVESLKKMLVQETAGDRIFSELLGIFSLAALLLAGIGIYGIVAYSVSQRTREIGIRMALGAERTSILRMVLGAGMKLALIGMALGLLASAPLPRAFASIFEDFHASATPVFLVTIAAIAIAALLACYIPARRAVKVNPISALRYE